MKKLTSLMAAILMVVVLTGCAGLWAGIVTLTQVRDNTMKELAVLYQRGAITTAMDAKITAADAKYIAAANTAADALEASKAGGDKGPYYAALSAAKAAVSDLIDILAPLTTYNQSVDLRTQLAKANSL